MVTHTGKRQLPNLQTPGEHTMCEGKGKGEEKGKEKMHLTTSIGYQAASTMMKKIPS